MNLYDKAKSYLGQDIIPAGYNPQVGCAISVWKILLDCGVTLGETPSTLQLQKEILADSRFEEVTEAEIQGGEVVMSATGTSTKNPPPLLHGHTGIMGKPELGWGIMSNDSESGLWREKWDLPSWKQFYGVRGGFPIRFFRLKVGITS